MVSLFTVVGDPTIAPDATLGSIVRLPWFAFCIAGELAA